MITVIVFDMAALEFEFLPAQMQELPGVVRIGIDPESHPVWLTGQVVCSSSIDQIMQTVRELRGPKAGYSISLRAKDI